MFNKIRLLIAKRPLYVMFEKELKCDPKTDHEFPKNILPLFDKQIVLLRENFKYVMQS